ncbi:hypothetical protein T492DRAFT_908267, partial [Pavlovales sp. CCMP2436]
MRELIAHAQLLSVLEHEFGKDLAASELDALATRLSVGAREVSHEPSEYAVRAGERLHEVVFMFAGTSEVLVDGRVVNTVVAPCLIGESVLRETAANADASRANDAVSAGGPSADGPSLPNLSTAGGGEGGGRADSRQLSTSPLGSTLLAAGGQHEGGGEEGPAAAAAREVELRSRLAVSQEAFVSDLFRSICDISDVSYERAGGPGLSDVLWRALAFKSVPARTLLAADTPRAVRIRMANDRAGLTADRAAARAARRSAAAALAAALAEGVVAAGEGAGDGGGDG